MGSKLKYALTFVLLMAAVVTFSVASVLAAANITVKNSIELNFVPCYTLLNGAQFNSRIPGSCTTIVFDSLLDEEGNPIPEYQQIVEDSIYTTAVTQDGSPNVNLYYVDTTAYILSNKTIQFPKNCHNMFYFLNTLESITFNNIETKDVQNMSAMFARCSSLQELDLEAFNTAKVTDFSSMFFKCEKLQNLNISTFETGEAENLNDMFSCCYKLVTLNLTHFNTGKVEKMAQMFYSCYALKELNISGFDTKNVANLTSVFYGCYALETVDLSSFTTQSLEKVNQMFCDCITLKTIYVSAGWVLDVEKTDGGLNMFYNCINLKFGNGNKYDTSKTDANYANVGEDGYLTLK